MTNSEFAKTDELFKFSCQAAGIDLTSRQASKWRNGRGKAKDFVNEGQRLLRESKLKALGK
jgi:hypothetical protein